MVTAAVYWGFNSVLAHLLLTFRHRAGVRPYTSTSVFAESCVFGKQSLPPFLCPLLAKGSFLPKLQEYIAEFLNVSYLEHLSILYQPTCVGLRYGLCGLNLEAVSWKPGFMCFTQLRCAPPALSSTCGFSCTSHRLPPSRTLPSIRSHYPSPSLLHTAAKVQEY